MDKNVDLETKITLIRKQPCFRLLNDSEVAMLADLFNIKTYAAGEMIVKQGDLVDSVFLIVSGDADVIVAKLIEGKRQEKNVATLHPEQAIGLSETGFYSLSGVRTATVIAKNDMVLLHLRIAVFHGFALAHAHVAEVMREFTGSRLQATQG